MAFEVTADSAALAYADLDTADAAAELTVGGSAWLELDDDVKEQHLNTASADIDAVDFIGTRATTTQELEWPRTGTRYSDDAWPQKIVDATIALARYNAARVSADASVDVVNASANTNDIKEDTVGPITTVYFDRGKVSATGIDRFPPFVQALLAPLVRAEAAAGWGSAAVVRTS